MVELIMLVGLPGSGKTTYAAELMKEGFHVHSSDAIREELYGDIYDQDHNQSVFQVLHKRIKEDLRNGISCVYDATNLSMKRRIGFLREINKIECNKECVLCLLPVEECKKRNAKRDKSVPDSVIDSMLCGFDVPMRYEGWDAINIICDKSVSYTYPIDDTVGFDQENSNHSKDLRTHLSRTTMKAVEYMKNMGVLGGSDRVANLVLAAYNHDIGKLKTKSFLNIKGEVTNEAHYYGHDHVGAYMYLLKSAYEDGAFCVHSRDWYVASLINWHMRPYLGWKQSDKARKKDKKMIGEQMYDDIMILHAADVAAH